MVKICLLIVGLTTLSLVSRAASLQFFIARELNNTTETDKALWINVKIAEKGLSEEDFENVSAEVDIPINISYSGIFIFFANDNKEILQVNMNDTIEGEFYETPHKLTKKLKGEKTTEVSDGKFSRVSGSFLKAWLPKNSSKISGAVATSDGKWYNYYGLQNFGISIVDLMVVEEYKNHNFS